VSGFPDADAHDVVVIVFYFARYHPVAVCSQSKLYRDVIVPKFLKIKFCF